MNPYFPYNNYPPRLSHPWNGWKPVNRGHNFNQINHRHAWRPTNVGYDGSRRMEVAENRRQNNINLSQRTNQNVNTFKAIKQESQQLKKAPQENPNATITPAVVIKTEKVTNDANSAKSGAWGNEYALLRNENKKYHEEVDVLKKQINDLKSANEIQEKQILEINTLSTTLNTLKEKSSTFNQEYKLVVEQNEKYKERVVFLEKQVRDFKTISEKKEQEMLDFKILSSVKLEDLKSEVNILKEKERTFTKQNKSLAEKYEDQVNQLKTRVADLKTSNETKEKQMLELNTVSAKRIGNLNSDINILKEKVCEYKRKHKLLAEKNEKYEKEIVQLKNYVNDLKIINDRKEKQILQAKAFSTNPKCELDALKKKLETSIQRYKSVAEKNKEYEKEAETLKKQFNDLKSVNESKEKAILEIKTLHTEQMERLQSELSVLKEKECNVNIETQLMADNNRKFEEEINQLKKQMNDLKNSYENKLLEMAKLSESISDALKLSENNLQKAENRLKGNEDELADTVTKLNETTQKYNELLLKGNDPTMLHHEPHDTAIPQEDEKQIASTNLNNRILNKNVVENSEPRRSARISTRRLCENDSKDIVNEVNVKKRKLQDEQFTETDATPSFSASTFALRKTFFLSARNYLASQMFTLGKPRQHGTWDELQLNQAKDNDEITIKQEPYY